MSQVYSTEPNTSGRIQIHTYKHGSIDISLFANECPIACQSFLQLVLDRYYENTIFHRILPKFLIQTGDKRRLKRRRRRKGEGNGSDAIAADDERVTKYLNQHWIMKEKEGHNSRIRFNHRGQVAMAEPIKNNHNNEEHDDNEGDGENLKGQFFITLDEAAHLNNKHVILGTIANSPTMFNALRIGDVATFDDDDEMMMDSEENDDSEKPKIKSIEIIENPFPNLVPSTNVPWRMNNKRKGNGNDDEEENVVKRRRKERKGKRDFNVLSFAGAGDNDEDDAEDFDQLIDLHNNNLQREPPKDDDDDDKGNNNDNDNQHQTKKKKKEDKGSTKQKNGEEVTLINEEKVVADTKGDHDGSNNKNNSDNDYAEVATTHNNKSKDFASKLREEIKSKRARLGIIDSSEKSNKTGDDEEKTSSSPLKSKLQPESSTMMGQVDARRAKYLRRGQKTGNSNNNKKVREDDTLRKLAAFKSRVMNVKKEKKKYKEKDDDGETKKREGRGDDSLASRMASKELEEENYGRKPTLHSEVYHGQILERGSDDDADAVVEGNSGGAAAGGWMAIQFKCKKHVDDGSSMSRTDNVDDYVVLDDRDKKKKKQKVEGRQRERHGHEVDKRRMGGRSSRSYQQHGGHHHHRFRHEHARDHQVDHRHGRHHGYTRGGGGGGQSPRGRKGGTTTGGHGIGNRGKGGCGRGMSHHNDSRNH